MNQEAYQKTTIVFPRNERGILLGIKKRGFGEGWWNGFGGKLEAGETYQDSANRETREEVGIQISNWLHLADLHFYFDDALGVVSRAYLADFTGKPHESDEMRPQFFPSGELPFDTMWPADKLWLPKVLNTNSIPLGFIIHFDGNKSFKSIDEVKLDQLAVRF